MLDYAVRHWWVLAIRGAAAVLFGILAVIWPDITLIVLAVFFGAYALIDGIFAGFSAYRAPAGARAPLVLQAILGVGLGLVVLAWPGVTLLVITIVIGLWAIFTGLTEIAAAVHLRQEIEGEWIYIASGAVSVIFGVLVAFWPDAGVVAMGLVIGICAMVFGVALIAAGLKLRDLGQSSTPPRAGSPSDYPTSASHTVRERS